MRARLETISGVGKKEMFFMPRGTKMLAWQLGDYGVNIAFCRRKRSFVLWKYTY
jgi:hypothetical protein